MNLQQAVEPNQAETEGQVMLVDIAAITIGHRHRNDMGDLESLAQSIGDIGLLQPIGITEDRTLIFGERRLRACRDILGLVEIEARIIDMPNIVVGENAENEVRKDFTPSERVAIAQAIEAELSERRGRPSEKVAKNCHFSGRTSDFAAEKAGFGNRETYRQAKHVVETAEPEVVDAMDRKVISISQARKIADQEPETQREIIKTGRTIADLEQDIHRRHKDGVQGDHPMMKIQTITNATMDIAYCGLSAEEFREIAPRPTLERLKKVALPAFQFLKNFVEVSK